MCTYRTTARKIPSRWILSGSFCLVRESRCCLTCWRFSAAFAEYGPNIRAAGNFSCAYWRLLASCEGDCVSLAAAEPVSPSNIQRGRARGLFHAAGHRRSAISSAAALPGGAGIHADSVWAVDHPAGARFDDHKISPAEDFEPSWLPRRAGVKHSDFGFTPATFCDHPTAYTGFGHRYSGVLLRSVHFAAVYEHEHACVCRRDRRGDKQRELDC